MAELTTEQQPAAVAEEVPGEPPVRWRDSLRFALWTWLAALAVYVLVTVVAWLPFEQVREAPLTFQDALANWHRWDTTWYVMIAESGYHLDGRSAAFFPLYPLLVAAVNPVLPGGGFEAALVVSLLSCYAALVVVHRFTAELLGAELARRTTFYLIAFPTGFFLAAAYNESLFVALTVGSLYAMRRQRWWLAGALAGLASGTRLAGALLAVVFAYEYLRQRGFSYRLVRVDLLGVALAPLGLLAYAAYCWHSFGDPLYFQHAQAVWFRSGFAAPWDTLVDVVRLIMQSPAPLSPTTVRNVINLATLLGVAALLYLAVDGRWRLGPGTGYLVLFSALDILLPVVSPIHADYPLSSMWRFALECPPVFMVLARMGRSATFDRSYLMVALALQGVMILTFVQNQFVA
jgi:Gpi18-like mannosyltransferase